MITPAQMVSLAVALIGLIGGLGGGYLTGRRKSRDETLESLSKANRYLADRLGESQEESETWRHKFIALEGATTAAAKLVPQIAVAEKKATT